MVLNNTVSVNYIFISTSITFNVTVL